MGETVGYLARVYKKNSYGSSIVDKPKLEELVKEFSKSDVEAAEIYVLRNLRPEESKSLQSFLKKEGLMAQDDKLTGLEVTANEQVITISNPGPQSLFIHSSGAEVVFKPDGTVECTNPEALSEVAQSFWKAMGAMNPMHMENLALKQRIAVLEAQVTLYADEAGKRHA